jgi:hypothetical protein
MADIGRSPATGTHGLKPAIQRTRERLCCNWGLRAARGALRPGGMLAVWSAYPEQAFSSRFQQAGFRVEEFLVDPDGTEQEPPHTIWFAAKWMPSPQMSGLSPSLAGGIASVARSLLLGRRELRFGEAASASSEAAMALLCRRSAASALASSFARRFSASAAARASLRARRAANVASSMRGLARCLASAAAFAREAAAVRSANVGSLKLAIGSICQRLASRSGIRCTSPVITFRP